MWRTFGIQTLTGSAQPLFSDQLTASLVIAASDPLEASVTIADTSRYRVGDLVVIAPGTFAAASVQITTITSATSMLVKLISGILSGHAANAPLALALPYAELTVQVPLGGAEVTVGLDNAITAAPSGNVIEQIQPTGSFVDRDGYTLDFWIVGTTGQTVMVAAKQSGAVV